MEYVKKLTSWLNKQPLVPIKFLYFHSSDLTKPRVRTAFKRFSVNGNDFYIVEGVTRNFFYVYSESVIKYLVNLVPTSDADVYDATIVSQGSGYDVNHGDHIDISIIQMRNNETLVKTHKTAYIDIGSFVFVRTAPQCNFVSSPSKLADVDNIKCELLNGRLQGNRMKDVYDAKDLDAIRFLFDIATKVTPGGARRCQFGGSFMNADEIIYKKLLKPLYEHRPDLEEVRIIHQDRKKHIVVIVDFIEDRRSLLLLKWPIENDVAVKKAITALGTKETYE